MIRNSVSYSAQSSGTQESESLEGRSFLPTENAAVQRLLEAGELAERKVLRKCELGAAASYLQMGLCGDDYTALSYRLHFLDINGSRCRLPKILRLSVNRLQIRTYQALPYFANRTSGSFTPRRAAAPLATKAR